MRNPLPLILAGALLAGMSATAQVQRSGNANTQLMQQYQQLQAERDRLQAENAKLQKDLADLKTQLDGTQQQLTASKAGSSRSQAALAAAEAANAKSLEESKAKTQELVTRFRETIANLKTVETERTQLQQQLAQSRAAFDQCALRNDQLYQVTEEILNRYEHQGIFSGFERAEPFTRIKRTQIENLALEYRERAAALRVQKSASPAVPAPPPAQGAPAAPATAPAPAPPTAPAAPQPAPAPAPVATPAPPQPN